MAPAYDLGFGLEHLQEQVRDGTTYKEKMEKETEDRWNEMKEMAIEHLKSCSGPGPKVLRTVVLDHDRMSGLHFHSTARTEEIQVWN